MRMPSIFRLVRCGADLRSEAKAVYLAAATNSVFDRRFPLYMKKRGAKNAFFAMWVDNAELLGKPAH